MTRYPSRIVCLTEETTETLYLLGQGDRVVGVSGYTVRPPEARLKPKVSAFINAKFDKIEALRPDLVLAFSDLQADLAAELVRRGIAVVTFNQRTVAEILQMIRMVGGLVGLGVTVVMTAELVESYTELRLSPHGVSFLTDGIILQRYVELDGALRKLVCVVKMRGFDHAKEMKLYDIRPDGIVIGEALSSYRGLLTGAPEQTPGPKRG